MPRSQDITHAEHSVALGARACQAWRPWHSRLDRCIHCLARSQGLRTGMNRLDAVDAGGRSDFAGLLKGSPAGSESASDGDDARVQQRSPAMGHRPHASPGVLTAVSSRHRAASGSTLQPRRRGTVTLDTNTSSFVAIFQRRAGRSLRSILSRGDFHQVEMATSNLRMTSGRRREPTLTLDARELN